MYILTTGELGYKSSSRRFKRDIQNLNLLEFINKRNQIVQNIRQLPVSAFKFKEGAVSCESFDNIDKEHVGLIAEDVAQYFSYAANFNPEDPTIVDGWDSQELLPAILLLAQEAMNKVEELEQEIKQLKGE